MGQEIEMKILEINPAFVRKRLKALGARLVGKYNFKRVVFQVLDEKDRHVWFRVRTDGHETTLTLKDNNGRSILSTKEYEVKVNDFKETVRMFSSVFNNGLYEENKREEYSLDGTSITIDFLPFLKPYVEVEGKTKDKVNRMIKKLNIGGVIFGNAPASEVYKRYGMDFMEIASKNKAKLKKLLQ